MGYNICVAIVDYEPFGQGRVVYETVRRLARRHRVTLLAQRQRREAPLEIRVHGSSLGPLEYAPLPRPALARFLRGFDIVHAHSAPYVWAASKAGVPSILTDHGVYPWTFAHKPMFRLKCFLGEKAQESARRSADAIIAISRCIRNHLNTVGRESFLIPNGVDTTQFRRFEFDSTKEYRLGNPALLTVSAEDKKRVTAIIRAMPLVLRKYPHAGLTVIGAGFEEFGRKQKPLASKLGISDHIIHRGFVPESKLPYFYNACDVYVTATPWEGFGLPIVEAMACEKPVVARNAYAMREHLLASNAGILFEREEDLAEALCDVLADPGRYGRIARDYALQFDWDDVCRKIEHVYSFMMDHNE